MPNDNLKAIVSEGFVSAKSGKGVETYLSLLPYHQNGQMQKECHYAFGWIIYYALHQTPDSEILERKKMLAIYLKLCVPRPHKLHSMILTEAVRLAHDAKAAAYNKKESDIVQFVISAFMSLWDFSNLRPGDWRVKEHEGQKLPSLVEKLITVYTDELEDRKLQPSATFVGIVDKALEVNPLSPSLLSKRASLHMMCGNTEEARHMLRQALLLAPGKFFLWSRLAALISPAENTRLYLALLYRALCAPGQEQFKGRIRLMIANALLSHGMAAEALHELLLVKQCYESNGWHMPKAYDEAMNKIPKGTIPVSPSRIYDKVSHLADEEIYGAISPIGMTKTYHKPPTDKCKYTAWRVTDSNGQNFWLQPHRWGINPDLPHGTALHVRLHLGKVVHAEVCELRPEKA